ncbi:hypothetical protein EDB80DRAFT_873910 [Ilyonectria destructans]|nr:hypothetical protein EDB80DRAFT_873910 [Ilyonectria destructans]
MPQRVTKGTAQDFLHRLGTSRITSKGYDAESVLVMACSTLALYNAFELLSLIFTTFKKRKGLYFWSICLASFGSIPYCVGWDDLFQGVGFHNRGHES